MNRNFFARTTFRAVGVFGVLGLSTALASAPASAAPRRRAVNKAPARRAPARRAPTRTAVRRPAGPSSPAARRALAIEYVKQAATAYERGDYRRTIQLCDTAADWYPTYARAHVWMGAAYQKLGNVREARLAYSWAKALSPNSADAQRAERGLREVGPY